MNLFTLFDTGMVLQENQDPVTDNLQSGIANLIKYSQDNVNGFPVYSSEIQVASVYADLEPQKVKLSENVSLGDLLNVYVPDPNNPAVMARKASAGDPKLFANSAALAAGVAGSMIECAVKVCIVAGTSIPRGPLFLAYTPGKSSPSMFSASHKIVQKVGESDGSSFMFYFHSPFLLDWTDLRKIKNG